MPCECRSWKISFKNKVNLTKKRKTKNWFTSTRPQTTAYVTKPWDLQECWGEYVGAMTSPQTDAGRCVTLVDWNIKQLNRLSGLSAGVGLCGVVAWNAIRARRSILRQLAPRKSRRKLSSPALIWIVTQLGISPLLHESSRNATIQMIAG